MKLVSADRDHTGFFFFAFVFVVFFFYLLLVFFLIFFFLVWFGFWTLLVIVTQINLIFFYNKCYAHNSYFVVIICLKGIWYTYIVFNKIWRFILLYFIVIAYCKCFQQFVQINNKLKTPKMTEIHLICECILICLNIWFSQYNVLNTFAK